MAVILNWMNSKIPFHPTVHERTDILGGQGHTRTAIHLQQSWSMDGSEKMHVSSEVVYFTPGNRKIFTLSYDVS